ncbi:MAG: pilus assembly FimT family protein [bacterium]
MIKKGVHSGFTLIELMVVTVLIGLIVLISIPVVNSVNNKFTKATRVVSGAVKQAREFAVTKGDTVLISFNESGATGYYKIYKLTGGSSISLDLTGNVPSEVSLNNHNYTQLVFLPLGSLDTITSTCDSVFLKMDNQTLTVKVFALTGIARIIKY